MARMTITNQWHGSHAAAVYHGNVIGHQPPRVLVAMTYQWPHTIASTDATVPQWPGNARHAIPERPHNTAQKIANTRAAGMSFAELLYPSRPANRMKHHTTPNR